MAKRKRSRSSGEATSGRAGDPSASSDEKTEAEADPLDMPTWPTAGCPEEEVGERQRFEQAWAAFRAGNFHACRLEATALAKDATSEEVRLRAYALEERLRADPLAIAVATGAFLLLVTAIVATFG